MATSNKPATFSFKGTSVTYQPGPDGDGFASINCDGTATGYGTVLGTLSFFADAPGAKTGRTSWIGTAFLDDGTEVRGSSEGFYESAGKHKWRVRGLLRTSTGAMLLTDGEVSLKGRSYKGTLTEL
jgi:hypothetical protein